MTLIERLRLSFNVQCQSTIDLNNEAADRLEQAEKVIGELVAALNECPIKYDFHGDPLDEVFGAKVDKALASAKLFKGEV